MARLARVGDRMMINLEHVERVEVEKDADGKPTSGRVYFISGENAELDADVIRAFFEALQPNEGRR